MIFRLYWILEWEEDIYENIEKYNSDEECKILITFDGMIAEDYHYDDFMNLYKNAL